MKLYAILCWWDESPTWLSATVASLARIGVDHLIAVDGRYPHFQMGSPVRSRPEQVEAIQLAAAAIGIGVTIHQPAEALTEVEKRALAFHLLEVIAEPIEDWVFIIDSDELVVDGSPQVKAELRDLHSPCHVARAAITNAEDPHADPDADNGITQASERLYQTMPQARPDFTASQSRFFRVMHGMTTSVTHWTYNGYDADGVRWFLRNDTGKQDVANMEPSQIARLENRVEILHRKNQRIAHRQASKTAYYKLRDELGIES